MCDDVPDFQRCDGYDAPLNTCPYALFDSLSDDPTPSPQLSSISSQVNLSSFDSLDKVPLPQSFPGQSFSIHRIPVTHGRQAKGKTPEQGPPLHQSILFANSSCPGGVSAASACSTHGCELEHPSSGSTLEAPQICITPADLPPSPVVPEQVPGHGHLVPALPNYLNYIWTLVIYDGRYPFNGKTEEQNDCIRLLSEIYQGTDIALDRVPELLHHSHTVDSESIAGSIEKLLSDLTINVSTLQYHLVNRYSKAQVQKGPGDDTPATAGSTVGEKHDDITIKVKEATPDPWSSEPLEFAANDRYSKKRDACFSEAAKFLSETTSFAPSTFTWRSFLDTAAWNKADHSLHNAINTTTPIPPTTFHPVVVNGMLRLYLAVGYSSCESAKGKRGKAVG
ncbi:hypothetical protein PISMIDRAFT_11028 [Pisolithus microcarpus 441]|uniref:Uncharacterized protein n=1 Tax=Pisolithus microcarpus 441 TaxID=765257 RepID=A0A0C9YEG2_9AGAM|nr:hypothetical protein PISMIDRAFT_11028 [Pisolithus microcarpus 441]